MAPNVKILDNDFVNNNRVDISILSVALNCFEWQSKESNFPITAIPLSRLCHWLRRGICEDFYRAGTPGDQVKGSITK